MDGMESSGEMRNLYKEFKEDLEAARSAKVSRMEISGLVDWLTVFSQGDIQIGLGSLDWIVVAIHHLERLSGCGIP